MAAAMLLAVVGPAFAGNFWNGGSRWAGTGKAQGVDSVVEGYDSDLGYFHNPGLYPYSQSVAYVMLANDLAGRYAPNQFIQVGYVEDSRRDILTPVAFVQWTAGGSYTTAYYRSITCDTGQNFDFKITSDSTNWYTQIYYSGTLINSVAWNKAAEKDPDGNMWIPDSPKYEGETYYASDQFPGAIGRVYAFDPVEFMNCKYKDGSGTWRSLYPDADHIPTANNSGATTAVRTSNSFEIYDTRY